MSGCLADYATDPTGVIVKSVLPQDILIDTNVPASATSKVSVGLNLDARMIPPTLAFDPANNQTYNSATSTKIYDLNGNAHDLTMYFAKTSENTWQIYTTSSSDLKSLTYPLSVTAGTNDQFSIQLDGGATTTVTLPPGQYVNAADLKTGFQAAIDISLGQAKATVSLDASNHLVVSSVATGTASSVVLGEGNGALANYMSVTNSAGSLKFDASGNADSGSSQVFTVNTGTGMPSITLDFTSSTQYANSFGENAITSDGYATGQLLDSRVEADGVIQAKYSNGHTRKVAQIALANFTNLNGLFRMGNNSWAETLQSGAARLDTAANPDPLKSLGLGVITGNAIEESNVNQGEELLSLLTQQRAYQANAQSIKAQDQLLQALVSIR